MKSLEDIRREYNCTSLKRTQLHENPFTQFEMWLDQAQQAELKDATAMTLATSDGNHMPDARIVLLKQVDAVGFSWYTNYSSTKGHQLEHNHNACLLFYWREFDRQVKIQGTVEKLSTQEAEEYFHSRPLDSQFSAAASNQSQPIESREILEQKVESLKQQNPDEIARPESWGGYRLLPTAFEFWQGRENRLHDRFNYTLNANCNWSITRLQP